MACLASATALGIVAFGNFGEEGMIERSVADAIDRTARDRGTSPAPQVFDPAHVRLSSLPIGPAIGAHVSVGDRITLAQREGGAATYEVVEVRPLAPKSIGAGAESVPNLMLVTAVTTAGRIPAQTIRFIFDGDAKTPAAPEKPHAL